MDNSQFNRVVAFIKKYGGSTTFRSGNVAGELTTYLLDDSCIIEESDDKILGILCYEILEFFPLQVEITELISPEYGVMVILLEKLGEKMPKSFRLFANRNLKTIEYKNPRRILKLIQHLTVTNKIYGSRPVST